jgi:hypothetical protein
MKFKIILISLIFLAPPLTSEAIGLTTPFGGKILQTIYCSCTSNFYIQFSDVTTQTTIAIIYQPGQSRLNQNHNVFSSNVNILGTYMSMGTCKIYSGNSCHMLQTKGTITSSPGPGVGTSN